VKSVPPPNVVIVDARRSSSINLVLANTDRAGGRLLRDALELFVWRQRTTLARSGARSKSIIFSGPRFTRRRAGDMSAGMRGSIAPSRRGTVATALALVLGLLAGCAAEVAPATERELVAPAVTPEAPGIDACWIETGSADVSGELATQGPTELRKWHATASALLVRHPDGDLLVDAGTSATLREDSRELKAGARIYVRASAGRMKFRETIAAQLERIGLRPADLDHIVLTHVHPDHAGGIEALPAAPVWVGPAEIDFVHEKLDARDHHLLPRHGRALRERMRAVPFEPRPYSIFDESWDVFGDGHVVVVPLFGHTPGSVGVFVDLGDGRRIFHVGDVVLVEESVERGVVKGKLMQPTDVDRERNAENVARLARLHELDPDLVILPAHDRDVWQRIFGDTMPERPACVRTEK
jgi:glyoxylase-like metal-dependent hydrolase (beta-lactamase superfamily II)